MEFNEHTYTSLVALANEHADKQDVKSVLSIKEELVRRIERRLAQDESPKWGSLMGYYEICTILEAMEDD